MNLPAKQVGRNAGADKVDRALFDLLKSRCSRHDFALAGITDLRRSSDQQLERHLNTRWCPDRLDPFRRYSLCAHRRNRETLFVCPKRRAARHPPSIFLCYRIELGKDPALARRQFDCLNHQLHGGLLHVEEEDGVLYAYAWYTLPRQLKDNGAPGRYYSSGDANLAKETAEAWLKQTFMARGWPSPVQLLGSFTEFSHANDFDRVHVIRRAEVFRAPKCREEGDLLSLRLSTFSAEQVPWFWRPETRNLFHVSAAFASDIKSRPDETWAMDCLLRSIAKCFGCKLPKHQLCSAQKDRILRAASQIWHVNPETGSYGVFADMWLGDLLRRLLGRILEKCKEIGGFRGGKLTFAADDRSVASQLSRSRIPQYLLRVLNAEPKLKGCKITYEALEIALCTIAKNSHTSNGFVPTKSVRKMLRYFRISANGTLVRLIFEALENARLIRCTDPSFEIGVRPRRWEITKTAYAMPFVAHLQPASPQGEPSLSCSANCSSGARVNHDEPRHITDSGNRCELSVEQIMLALHPDIYGHVEVSEASQEWEFQ